MHPSLLKTLRVHCYHKPHGKNTDGSLALPKPRSLGLPARLGRGAERPWGGPEAALPVQLLLRVHLQGLVPLLFLLHSGQILLRTFLQHLFILTGQRTEVAPTEEMPWVLGAPGIPRCRREPGRPSPAPCDLFQPVPPAPAPQAQPLALPRHTHTLRKPSRTSFIFSYLLKRSARDFSTEFRSARACSFSRTSCWTVWWETDFSLCSSSDKRHQGHTRT